MIAANTIATINIPKHPQLSGLKLESGGGLSVGSGIS
jgi:hypothetical protein